MLAGNKIQQRKIDGTEINVMLKAEAKRKARETQFWLLTVEDTLTALQIESSGFHTAV